MRRRQLFQFSHQPWLPASIRSGIRDFLSFVVERVGAAKPFVPLVEEGLGHAGARRLIDLDLGLGGGIEQLAPLLPDDIEVVRAGSEDFPTATDGLHTILNGFHTRTPEENRAVLARAAALRRPIAVLEGNNDNGWQAVGMLVFVPLMVLLFTPLVRPFSLTRLALTYLLPVIPFCIVWDGVAALFMLYGPGDLRELVDSMPPSQGYAWRAGKEPNGRGGKIIYLLGWPT